VRDDGAAAVLGHRDVGAPISVSTPEFWFEIQLAMLTGFATAHPVDALPIRTGAKGRM
jgi:hypothetical protein